MARFGIGFNKNGNFTAFPTVFSSVNADNLDMRNQGPTGTVAILGTGAGFFEPGKASSLPFNLASPQRHITASDLLTASEFAIRPFAEIDRGVGQIYVVPVNASTKSTIGLKEGGSGGTLIVTLNSKGWGLKFNSITAGHTAGTYETEFNAVLTKLDADVLVNSTDYNATLAVTTLANWLTQFNLLLVKLDGDTGVIDTDYEALLTAADADDAFNKLGELLRKLDTDTGVTDTNYAALHGDATPNKLTLTLPTATSSVIETFSYIAATRLAADVNERSALVDAILGVEATVAIDYPTATPVAFTGGTEPAATNQNWTDALEALNGIRVNTIHVATSDPAIWSALAAYCIIHRCRGFVGSELKNWNGVSNRQASIGTLKAEAGQLNAPRMMHVGLGIDGKAGYLSAARIAALSAAVDPSQPITYKHVEATSLETKLDIATEVGGVDGLLLYGVAPLVPDPHAPNTFLQSRGLSTWTGDDNLYRREHSVLAAIDALQDNIEAAMVQFLGKEGNVRTVERALRVLHSVLTAATDLNATVRINGFREESLNATFTTDTVLRITAAVEPTPPINFVDVILNLERTEIDIDFDINLAA